MRLEYSVEAVWKDVKGFPPANIRERSTTDMESIAYAVTNTDRFLCYYY